MRGIKPLSEPCFYYLQTITIVKNPHKINSNTANNFSSDAGKQFFIANEKNRLRWVVLGLSQDGACIDLFENRSENSLMEDLSNITTFNPPLFSLVNTFKRIFYSLVCFDHKLSNCSHYSKLLYGLLQRDTIFFRRLLETGGGGNMRNAYVVQ